MEVKLTDGVSVTECYRECSHVSHLVQVEVSIKRSEVLPLGFQRDDSTVRSKLARKKGVNADVRTDIKKTISVLR